MKTTLTKRLLLILLMMPAAVALALPLGSKHVIVVDEESGNVLFEKNSNDIVPIASLTKLMTAMVVLDANQDMNELISIDMQDVDMLKHSSSRVPVGVLLPRHTLLELALMSSDNRAAAALARTYPTGFSGFQEAVRTKAHLLGMRRTSIEEPTGLSRHNTSTAADMVKLARAAASYHEISKITTAQAAVIDINGQATEYRNTNRLLGNNGWNILLSKTGFTSEAGRCIVMRVQAAGRNAIMVLLNARESAIRTADAMNLNRFLTGEAVISQPLRSVRSGGMILAKSERAIVKKKKRQRVVKNLGENGNRQG